MFPTHSMNGLCPFFKEGTWVRGNGKSLVYAIVDVIEFFPMIANMPLRSLDSISRVVTITSADASCVLICRLGNFLTYLFRARDLMRPPAEYRVS